MFRFPLALATALASVCAAPALAETDHSAAADLATIRQKAEATPGTLRALDQLARMGSQALAGGGPDTVGQLVLGQSGIGSRGRFPLNINATERQPAAAMRARFLEQILSADLDNDWSVTRAELTDTLLVRNSRNGTAELFLLGDKDGNNILSWDEIKAVVAAQADANTPRRGALPLSIFDFDGDGQLSQEELDRTVRALSQ